MNNTQMVSVPKKWRDDVVAFLANFTSGNSIPVDIRFIVKTKGDDFVADATRLRDMLSETVDK